MDRAAKTERNRMRKMDLMASLAPTLVWDSLRQGTAVRAGESYTFKPFVPKRKRRLTEAEDNAIGRAIRRRENRRKRAACKPHALR